MNNDGKPGVSLTDVYRHDVHKLLRRTHAEQQSTFEGISVNVDVPLGADRDVPVLSGLESTLSPQLEGHQSHRRLSLLTARPLDDDDQEQSVEPRGSRRQNSLLRH